MVKEFFKLTVAAIAIIFLVTGCSKHENKTVEQLNKEAIQFLTKRDIPKALEKAQEALKLSRKKYGEEDLRTAECLKNVALVYQASKDYTTAVSFYKKSLTLLEKNGKGDGKDAAQILNNLASFAYMSGQYDHAAIFYKKCLEIAKKAFPAGDKRISVIETNLKRCEQRLNPKEQNNSPATPAVANVEAPPIEDLVPDQIKKFLVDNLAKQKVYLSDFKPQQMLKIKNQGVVFPYTCIKRDGKSEEGVKTVALFAAVRDKKDETKIIFQKTRLVSFEAYNAKLSEGGIPLLQKEMVKLFPHLFS